MKPLTCLEMEAGYGGIFFYNYVLIFLSATDAISPAYGFCPLFNSKIYHDIFKQLHTFPEGKIAQEDQPIRRLKWGTASLIVRAPITPIVLPIVHSGFEKVMPENSFFGRRPPVPLCSKKIDIIVGEPIEFDLPSLKQEASTVPHDSSSERKGWPAITPDGLDEAAQRWLYQKMSDKVQSVMERLRKTVTNLKQR
uniref:Tafazzin family protein n=1 Tax=Zea mays TaxID=4577 RepID=A0A804RM21_MAIZE